MDDFYIGYEPPMPRGIARVIRRATIVTLVGAAGIAVLLAREHVHLEGGAFAYGRPETFTGRIGARPYPRLVETGAPPSMSTALLVAPGKHGADAMVSPFDGARVQISGTPIARDGHRMVELRPGSVRLLAAPPSQAGGADAEHASHRGDTVEADAGTTSPVQLRGEIVDSKCYLGVMVPGEGHTHAACAALCLRGGIPPALVVRRQQGGPDLHLLETLDGNRLDVDVAAWAGVTIEVTGFTGRRDGWSVLRTSPSDWRRVTR